MLVIRLLCRPTACGSPAARRASPYTDRRPEATRREPNPRSQPPAAKERDAKAAGGQVQPLVARQGARHKPDDPTRFWPTEAQRSCRQPPPCCQLFAPTGVRKAAAGENLRPLRASTEAPVDWSAMQRRSWHPTGQDRGPERPQAFSSPRPSVCAGNGSPLSCGRARCYHDPCQAWRSHGRSPRPPASAACWAAANWCLAVQ